MRRSSFGEDADVDGDGAGGFADQAAEAAEDALDLALLFDLELAPVVREVDDGERLDEERWRRWRRRRGRCRGPRRGSRP